MPEAEQIQRRMGKMILRCSEKMTNEVVLGELGWWSMKGRRDMMRLLFWRKIVCMSPSRLVHHVYSVGRAQHQAGKHSKRCKETHTLLQSLGLEHIWSKDGLSEEENKLWRATLKAQIQHERGMEGSNAKQAKASHISSPEEQFVLRGIPEAPRPQSKGDDDAPERRHKRTQDRERTSQSNEQRPDTTRERASLSDLCVWRGRRRSTKT